VILMTAQFWQKLGLTDHVELQLNSLGSNEARAVYRDALVAFLTQHESVLDEDSKRRMHTNPLRVLDSKSPEVQAILVDAPKLSAYLDQESKEHFAKLCEILDAAGVKYVVNEKIVRGLDYYNRTVFEWVTDSLGSQGTVCAGGRYDGLVEQIGGKATPAVGFAMGLERLVLMLDTLELNQDIAPEVDVYSVLVGEGTDIKGMLLTQQLRQALPSIKVMNHCGGGNFKKQMKRADKSGARIALILGESEIADNQVTVKDLTGKNEQQTVAQSALADVVAMMLEK